MTPALTIATRNNHYLYIMAAYNVRSADEAVILAEVRRLQSTRITHINEDLGVVVNRRPIKLRHAATLPPVFVDPFDGAESFITDQELIPGLE